MKYLLAFVGIAVISLGVFLFMPRFFQIGNNQLPLGTGKLADGSVVPMVDLIHIQFKKGMHVRLITQASSGEVVALDRAESGKVEFEGLPNAEAVQLKELLQKYSAITIEKSFPESWYVIAVPESSDKNGLMTELRSLNSIELVELTPRGGGF